MTLPPFDRLIDEHGPAVWRVCRALLPPTAADDAWSETFCAAWQAYPSLGDTRNLRGWFVTIAHRKAIDLLRREARLDLRADPPERATNDGYHDHALFSAVGALPDKQRAAVAYHYLGDLAYAEVAELLGVTETAARRAAADGIATLRLRYQKETS